MTSSPLYPARPGPRTIRLLELISAPGANVLEYELREHCIDTELSFEALSYVWGDTTVRKELVVHAQTVSVTVNLWNALQNLSTRSVHPCLWVDALCINQDDPVEHEEQASLVGEIYSGASRVLAWLGPDREGECIEAPGLVKLIHKECKNVVQERGYEVLPYARKVAEKGGDNAFLDVSIPKIEMAMEEANIPYSAWNAIRKLLDSRWFTRIWCVQEIGFARSAVLVMGAMSPILWEELAVVLAWYMTHELGKSNAPSNIKLVPYYYALNMFMGVEVDGHEGAEALVAALFRFHPFQATDPRDKVYGIMGLLSKSNLKAPLEIRYEDADVADVYTAVAMALIKERGDLKILYFTHNTSDDIHADLKDGMASWVPRWDDGRGLFSLDRNFRPGVTRTACGPHIYANISTSPYKTLRLEGLSFGQVEYVSRLIDGKLFDLQEDTEDECHAGIGLFIDMWKRATTDDDVNTERLARTLTADCEARGMWNSSDEEKNEKRKEVLASFYSWMTLVFKKQGVQMPTGNLPLDMLGGQETSADLFVKGAKRACDGRRLFWTSSGFLGLGPPAMDGGHEVVVLKGGSTPYVLKQHGDGWLYLGESYVDGIMHGECFSDEVEGWTRPTEQNFLLV